MENYDNVDGVKQIINNGLNATSKDMVRISFTLEQDQF